MCSLGDIIGLSELHKIKSKLTGALFILLALFFLSLPAQAKYGGGVGTENDPYLIHTAEQMNDIGAEPDDWNKHFKLTADIDMSQYSGDMYNIIGTDALEAFDGVFDGNGHKISNLNLTSTSQWHTGLFGYVSGQIKDLGLVNPNIVAQGGRVGSLAGYLDSGTITGCYAEAAGVSGDRYVGGLVGLSDGRIVNCYSSGSVSGDADVGGLVGLIGDGPVNTSYSKASVSGNRDVGGLAGRTYEETSAISNCYAIGSVQAGIYAGGLVGQIERGAAYRCYSTGSVSGDQGVGGLTGLIRVLGWVSNCFWDTQTSGQPASAGGTGKTTAEMQMLSTYTDSGWDFWKTWDICEGTNYPVLLWQIPIVDFRCPDGVNFVDFAFFASHWLDEACNPSNYYCSGTDLDQSGSIGFTDLEIFADHWLEGIP